MINAMYGTPVHIAATATVKPDMGRVIGFYVASTTGGTLHLRDGGAGGRNISGVITPAVGFHFFPAAFATDLHVTVANTINVTFFVN